MKALVVLKAIALAMIITGVAAVVATIDIPVINVVTALAAVPLIVLGFIVWNRVNIAEKKMRKRAGRTLATMGLVFLLLAGAVALPVKAQQDTQQDQKMYCTTTCHEMAQRALLAEYAIIGFLVVMAFVSFLSAIMYNVPVIAAITQVLSGLFPAFLLGMIAAIVFLWNIHVMFDYAPCQGQEGGGTGSPWVPGPGTPEEGQKTCVVNVCKLATDGPPAFRLFWDMVEPFLGECR